MSASRTLLRYVRPIAAACLFSVSVGGAADRACAQEPGSAFALDTLHVEVGSLIGSGMPAATRAIEVIDSDRIDRLPVRTVADVLRWAVGADVRVRSAAQADLSIRGTGFEQVLVTVDGVRVSDVQTGHFDLDLAVPLDAIDRVEVLRGPASALYGADAMGGVVNIVTRDDAGARFAGRLDGGSFGTAGAAGRVTLGDDRLGSNTSGEYRRSDGHRTGTDYTIAKGRTALNAAVADGTLRADIAFAARDFGAADFYAPFPSYEETRTLRASVAWRPPQEEGFSLEPRLSIRRHDDDFLLDRDQPDGFRNVHTSWQTGAHLAARYRPSERIRVAAGADVFLDRLESTNLGERDERRGAAFLEVAAGRIGHAALNAGVRADWHSEYGTFIAPSLAGAIWPAERLRVRASTGRAFRAPTWTDRYYTSPANIGDPSLDPERSTTTELGIDLYATSTIRIAAGGFLRSADALIDWARPVDSSPDDTPWRAMNIEDAEFRGLELELDADGILGIDWLARMTSLSFETDEATGYTSQYVLRPLTQTASLEAAATPFDRTRLTVGARRAQRHAEDAYYTVDARVAYTWGRGRVFVDALNLTDETYLDASAVPAAGRALYVGVEWRDGGD